MIGKMEKVVVPTWRALSAAGRDMVCIARAPGVRGYAEMASRLLLLSIILALPVIIFGKLIYLLDVAELALLAPLLTIGLIALFSSEWFARSTVGAVSRAVVETLHDPFGCGAAHVRRLRQG